MSSCLPLGQVTCTGVLGGVVSTSFLFVCYLRGVLPTHHYAFLNCQPAGWIPHSFCRQDGSIWVPPYQKIETTKKATNSSERQYRVVAAKGKMLVTKDNVFCLSMSHLSFDFSGAQLEVSWETPTCASSTECFGVEGKVVVASWLRNDSWEQYSIGNSRSKNEHMYVSACFCLQGIV